MHHRDIDEWREPLQGAKDQGPMRPRAGQGYIEMITPGLGSVAAYPSRAGRTIGGHPVTENTILTHEASAAGRGFVPLIVPTTINEQSHFILLKSSASIGMTCMPSGRRPTTESHRAARGLRCDG